MIINYLSYFGYTDMHAKAFRAISLATFIFLFLQSELFAQGRPGGGRPASTGTVSGLILEDGAETPIPTAAVALWAARDSSLVTGAVTTEDGRFSISGIRQGAYYVRISFLGYVTESVSNIKIDSQNKNVDIGTVFLKADAKQLAEVNVEAERDFVEIGIDRTVYNTEDQIASTGGSASEVLETIPSVEVDIDGNISLRGNQNVAILINGRPAPVSGDALASYLQGLSGELVERIEVIPNPSAKYEPDGMAGILNIVLKKNSQAGLSGSITSALGTSDNYNASGNLNYQKGALNVFSSYGFRHSSRDGGGDRYRENRYLDPLEVLEQIEDGERISDSNNANVVLDYSLSDKNTVSVSSALSYRDGTEGEVNLYDTSLFNGPLTSQFDRISDGLETDLNTDLGLTFRRVLDPGKHELVVEFGAELEKEDEDGIFTENDLYISTTPIELLKQNNEVDELEREAELNIDYTRPVGDFGRFETGGVSRLIKINNTFFSETFDPDQGAYQPDTDLNNEFNYDRFDNAAYAIYGHDFGRVKTQVGLRAEQSNTDFELVTTDENFDNNIFSLFPSAFAVYELSPSRSFKLSYSKRINRPRTRSLNPFSSQDDAFNVRRGNPYLKPEYVHSYEAGFTNFTERSSLTIQPYYQKTIDAFSRIQTLDDNGVTTLTTENFDTRENYGLEVISTFKLGSRFSANGSVNFYRLITDGSNVDSDLTNDALGWSGRVNATYTVTPSLDVQFSQFYRSPIDIEFGLLC